jgi:hypothetical protein
MNDDKFQKLIETKCNLCFRKDAEEDGCMLFSERHPGIELCLGPFKDQEDRTRKIREDFEKEEKPKPDLDSIARDVVLNTYLRNKKLFDNWVNKKNEVLDDEKKH